MVLVYKDFSLINSSMYLHSLINTLFPPGGDNYKYVNIKEFICERKSEKKVYIQTKTEHRDIRI